MDDSSKTAIRHPRTTAHLLCATSLRRVILAMIERERNLVVTRLADGRKKAHEAVCQRVKAAKRQGGIELGVLTQDGGVKSTGPSSFLAGVVNQQSAAQAQLKAVTKGSMENSENDNIVKRRNKLRIAATALQRCPNGLPLEDPTWSKDWRTTAVAPL